MPIRDCTNPNFSNTGGMSYTGQGQGTIELLGTMFGTISQPALVAQLGQGGTRSTALGFSAALWLVSGPGPTYTDEVKLCELLGAAVGDRVAAGTWQLSQPLPVAGRTWSATTDQIRFRSNGQVGPEAGAVTLDWRVCNEVGTVNDCCAELNGKLDEILRFVSKAYYTQP